MFCWIEHTYVKYNCQVQSSTCVQKFLPVRKFNFPQQSFHCSWILLSVFVCERENRYWTTQCEIKWSISLFSFYCYLRTLLSFHHNNCQEQGFLKQLVTLLSKAVCACCYIHSQTPSLCADIHYILNEEDFLPRIRFGFIKRIVRRIVNDERETPGYIEADAFLDRQRNQINQTLDVD